MPPRLLALRRALARRPPQDRGSVLMFDVATGRPAPPLEGGFKVGTFTYTYADGVPASHLGFAADGRFVIWSWGKIWSVDTIRSGGSAPR